MRRRAEIGGGLLVVLADRDEPAADDDDDVRERERDLSDRLRRRAEPEAGEHLQEQQQQRHAHHDLGSDERQQHHRVDRSAAGPPPALQAEGECNPERRRHEHADDAEEQRVAQRSLQGGVVEDAAALPREPTGRESLPRRPGAAVVEGEEHCQGDRDQRPEDVEDGDEHEEPRAPPGVAEPGPHASARSSAPRVARR